MAGSPMVDGNWSIGDDPALSKASRKSSHFSPRAIVVLGMHRSGTSALTRIFNLLGADLPKNLDNYVPENREDHWESSDLILIHEHLLQTAGSRWDDWRVFNPDWMKSGVAESYKEKLLGILRNDFAGSQMFVVKEPRICRFVPLWLDVLKEFGAAPSVVMPIRNPLEVAASLKRRDGFFPTKSFLLWLRHVLDAERATRHVPRAIVSYKDLLDDWRGVVATVATKTGLHWPRRSDPVELEIDRFLAETLRHHFADDERLSARADIVDWVKDAYAILTHLAENPDNPTDTARLDEIRGAFDKASAAFGVAFAQGEAELAREQSAVASLKSELLAVQNTVQNSVQDREALLGEHDQIAIALEEQKAAVARQAEQAAVLAQERETLNGVLHEREAAIARLGVEFDHAQSAGATRQAEIDKLGGELTSARAVVKDRDGAIMRLMRDLDAARGYLRESQTQVQRFAGELDSARTELKRSESDRARLAKIVTDGSAELDIGRSLITTIRGERDGLHATAAQLPALRAQVDALKQALTAARSEADRQERAIADSAAGLADAIAGKSRLAEELERANEALRRSEWTAMERIAALEALRTTSLADSDNRAQARVRVLQEKLVDAEAALAKHRYGRNRASWTRHLSLARHRALRQIAKSGLFDDEWYVQEYPDTAASGRPPAEHYFDEGYLRGYRPNPLFDTRWYLEHYEDVRRAGVNPLLHYIQYGTREGRDPGPDFHTDFYLVSNPDVRKSRMNPLRHYLRYGRDEGRPATRTGGNH